MKTVLRFLKDERGTETVEWAIIIGLIAVAAIGFITTIGTEVSEQIRAPWPPRMPASATRSLIASDLMRSSDESDEYWS